MNTSETNNALQMNTDVMSVITSFSRELTVSEIYTAIQEALEEFSAADDMFPGFTRRYQMKWFLSYWKPDMGDFPMSHHKFGEDGLTDSELLKAATAIKWWKYWSSDWY